MTQQCHLTDCDLKSGAAAAGSFGRRKRHYLVAQGITGRRKQSQSPLTVLDGSLKPGKNSQKSAAAGSFDRPLPVFLEKIQSLNGTL